MLRNLMGDIIQITNIYALYVGVSGPIIHRRCLNELVKKISSKITSHFKTWNVLCICFIYRCLIISGYSITLKYQSHYLSLNPNLNHACTMNSYSLYAYLYNIQSIHPSLFCIKLCFKLRCFYAEYIDKYNDCILVKFYCLCAYICDF